MGLYDSALPTGRRGGTYDSSGVSKKKKHRGGLLGGIVAAAHVAEHLATDVKDAAVGIPMGVKNIATHPIRSGKEIGKATWHDWSPLIHGHAGEWAHNFAEHPLNPILDVAAIATLGLGGGARAASALSRAGVISDTGRIATAAKIAERGRIGISKDGITHERTLSRSRGSAFRQALVHTATGRANPWFNNAKYFEKMDRAHQMEVLAGADYAMRHFVKAGKKLGTIDGVASVMQQMHRGIAGAARPLKAGHEVPKGWTTVLDPDASITRSASMQSTLYRKGALRATTDKSALHSLFENAHDRFLAPDDRYALKTPDGRLMVVPKSAIKGYSKEAANAGLTLKTLVSAPTTVWKYAVLGLRPGFFVNNAVGNMVMATIGHGPVAIHSWAKALGRPVAKNFRGEDSAFTKLINERYSNQRAAHFSGVFGATALEASKFKRVGKAALRGVSPVTGYVAENKIREGLIEVELKKNATVRRFHTKGRSWHDAMEAAHKHDPSLAEHISRRIDNVMGNYHQYNMFEKQVRNLVPFYGWQRAITRHTKNLIADRPTTTALLASQGQLGAADTANILGDIPDFMRGVIPLRGNKQNSEGRVNVLSTQGFNPYASDAEMVGALGAVTGLGNSQDGKFDLAGLLGPIPVGVMEQMTGTKATGAPAQFTKHGALAGIAQSIGYNLPETQLLLAAMGKLPPSASIDKRTGLRNQKLYKKDWEAVMSAYMGVPIKKYSPKAATKLKKKKKKSHG